MTAPTRLTPRSLGGLKIVKVGEMAPRFNALIYGDPGVGKTRLCASSDLVPEMRNVLILDVDGGALSAKEVYPNVSRIKVNAFHELQDIYDDLLANASHGFQTVCIDTGTEAQKYSMAAIMAKVVADAEAEGKERTEEVPSIREWGITSEQIRRMVRGYRDLPMNFLMTCHVADDEDKRTGIVKKSPDLPGKLKRQVAGFFDEVWYMYTKTVKSEEEGGEARELRLLMTAASTTITAKDRTDKLPKIITDCNMKSIYGILTGVKPNDASN